MGNETQDSSIKNQESKTTSHRIKMATATKSDIADMYTMLHVLEHIKEYEPTSVHSFKEMELSTKERNLLSQIFECGEICVSDLVHYLLGCLHGFYRVVMGYEVLFENCADPESDSLDLNKSIKESILVWNHLEERLKEGREVCITPDSTLGKMILSSAKEEQEKQSTHDS